MPSSRRPPESSPRFISGLAVRLIRAAAPAGHGQDDRPLEEEGQRAAAASVLNLTASALAALIILGFASRYS
jgi:hypothetical protein